MRRITILGLGLTLLLAADASAQTRGAIRGKVLDENSKAMEDVAVHVENQGEVKQSHDTSTNKKGEYTQIGIQPGQYRITFTKDGYQGSFLDHRVRIGDTAFLPDVTLKSREALQAAAAAPTETFREDFAAANELIRQGKNAEAEAALKALLEGHPDVPQLHNNLAYVYRQAENWAAAEAAYKKAMELDPELSDARVGLAQVYEASGRKDEALALLQSEDSANDPKVQFDLARRLLNEMKNDEALVALEKAQALGYSEPELHYHLGTLAVGRGDIPEAVSQLEQFLAANPDHPQYVATAQGLLQALKPKQ